MSNLEINVSTEDDVICVKLNGEVVSFHHDIESALLIAAMISVAGELSNGSEITDRYMQLISQYKDEE